MMKYTNKIFALACFLFISKAAFSQSAPAPDSLGLPGDNLNLYGVLYLFKESKNVEDFEQKLNTPDSKVNNLDLNRDGQTDYIRVKDYGQNGLHSLVLQDPITATESQDLAVIEIEQQGNGNAHIQIVGDEDLYGKNYIIEPQDEQQQPAVDNSNPSPPVIVNVWAWPSVQFIYGPSYVYWNSPWYYGYYPQWWSPWRPMYYHAYWRNMYGYRSYYHRGYENHIIAAHSIYYGHRQASMVVHNNITNNVYHGPRAGGKSVAPGTNPKNGNNPRSGMGGKQASGSINQPKQQSAPRQQAAPQKQHQVQNAPKQASAPRQPSVSQQAPRQQQAPRPQQQAPRQQVQAPRQQAQPHMGGGARMGGGGGHGGGRR